VTLSQPGVFIPEDLCARLAPALSADLRDAMRDKRIVDAEVMEAVQRVAVSGDAWVNGHRFIGTAVDNGHTDGVEWISAQQAARRLKVSDRAITARRTRGTLEGHMVNGAWRVAADSLTSRKDSR
jgi:hypothetical protein